MFFPVSLLIMKLPKKHRDRLTFWIFFQNPSCNFPENTETDSQARCVLRTWNFLGNTEMDSQAEGVLRIPHQLCNFIGITETDSHPGCVFRILHQSCNFPENTETDSHPGCIIGTPHQSCNFVGNTETDLHPECIFRTPHQLCYYDEIQRWTHNLDGFSGPLSVNELPNKLREKLTIWMCFQDPSSVMELPYKTWRQTHILDCQDPHQSCSFPENTDRLTI